MQNICMNPAVSNFGISDKIVHFLSFYVVQQSPKTGTDEDENEDIRGSIPSSGG